MIVVFDVYFEYLNGTNLLGFPLTNENQHPFGGRLYSFFKNEAIVGGYINGFYLIITGFFFNEYYFKQKKIILFLALIILLAIFFTGERSNFLKAFLEYVFLYFFRQINKNQKILLFSISLFSILLLIYNSQYFKLRYTSQIKASFGNESKYFILYKSGYQV